jgi:molybdopterin converting factor subunit 1
MITINVLFFASAKEITGLSKTKVELESGQTTVDFVAKLTVLFPSLNIQRDQISIAVNQVYCKETKELFDGDTIALLPPISGG